MIKYVAPEYLALERKLEPFIMEHGLDNLTIKSLIRGSMEIIEPEPPTALLAIIDANDLQKGFSIKLKNIKFNILFALNSIFNMKAICDEKGMWSILALLKAICSFAEEIYISFEQADAIVLFCVYRLQLATVQQIQKYHNECNFQRQVADIELDDNGIQGSLDNLEKKGVIDVDEGKYFVKESIIVRNNK
ncbi:MAG: hypothetical protein NC124_06270 [Clostridium sp.]|nr:hypothetical protein [Clostridium sp.]